MQMIALDPLEPTRVSDETPSSGQSMARSAQRSLAGPTTHLREPLTVPRRKLWAAAVAVTVVALLASQPLGTACATLALSAGVAAALAPPPSRHGFGALHCLPAAFVAVCCWALLLGLLGGLLGVSVWSSRPSALIGVLGLACLTGTVSWRRGGPVALIGRDGPAAVGFLALAGFFCWVIIAQPLTLWSRLNGSGTDFLRHLRFIAATRDTGLLIAGEPSYPKALAALGSLVSAAVGVPETADAQWRAVAPLSFLMLALMLLAVLSIASHLTNRVIGGRAPRFLAASIAGVAFVQTAWFSTFLAFGSMMNMIVGVALLSVLAQGLDDRSFISLSGTVVAGSVVAVTANAWQLLLPVAAVAAFPWFIQFVRRARHRGLGWLMWITAALLSINGVLGLRTLNVSEQAAIPTVSNLFGPEWWWWVALALAVLVIAVAFSRGLRTWAVVALSSLVVSAALVMGLIIWTGSSLELIRYYPVKALWTAMVIAVPLGASGAALAATEAWRRGSRGGATVRLSTRSALALVIGVVVLGSLGRMSAFPPHLVNIAEGRVGMPNWSLALIDAMRGVPVPEESKPGAVVLGVVPSTNVAGIVGGFVGTVDYIAMESLAEIGIEAAMSSSVKSDISVRDMEQICLYLKKYPASLRVTGPNPAAGPGWLLDAGCPKDVVQPDRWISLQFTGGWLANSAWQDGVWHYPTVAEVEAARDPQT